MWKRDYLNGKYPWSWIRNLDDYQRDWRHCHHANRSKRTKLHFIADDNLAWRRSNVLRNVFSRTLDFHALRLDRLTITHDAHFSLRGAFHLSDLSLRLSLNSHALSAVFNPRGQICVARQGSG